MLQSYNFWLSAQAKNSKLCFLVIENTLWTIYDFKTTFIFIFIKSSFPSSYKKLTIISENVKVAKVLFFNSIYLILKQC